jgi:hypothetical protein
VGQEIVRQQCACKRIYDHLWTLLGIVISFSDIRVDGIEAAGGVWVDQEAATRRSGLARRCYGAMGKSLRWLILTRKQATSQQTARPT